MLRTSIINQTKFYNNNNNYNNNYNNNINNNSNSNNDNNDNNNNNNNNNNIISQVPRDSLSSEAGNLSKPLRQ